MGKILVEYGERSELEKLFNVSKPTIRAALAGKTKSGLAKRIRKAAVERGGVESK